MKTIYNENLIYTPFLITRFVYLNSFPVVLYVISIGTIFQIQIVLFEEKKKRGKEGIFFE